MTRSGRSVEAERRHHARGRGRRSLLRLGVSALLLANSGCDLVRSNFLGVADAPKAGTPGFVRGFLGAVVADEPAAGLAARDVLSAGGSAGDAAVAAGFMLSVTLPSRAGLGGGGACLAFTAGTDGKGAGSPEAILFPAPASTAQPGGDRPAAVPMLARGLFALHSRYGRRPLEELIVPAEQQARFGVAVSRALVRDIDVVAAPLAGDPNAAAIFVPGGTPLSEGRILRQPALAATLAQLRTAGVGDLYQGALSKRLIDASAVAGGPLTESDLRGALPRFATPVNVPVGRDILSVPPDAGGLATAASLLSLRAGDAAGAEARGLAVAAAVRQRGPDPALLRAKLPAGDLPALPASTTFATLDRRGNAVICAVSMNNLFGTGRIAPGTGILLAASPSAFPPPLLAIAMATNIHLHAFRAEAGGSGQAGAPLAAALSLQQELDEQRPAPPPDPGRANLIGCARYLPGAETSCGWRTDPRGAGLAIGSG